jgi:hypothetical protein
VAILTEPSDFESGAAKTSVPDSERGLFRFQNGGIANRLMGYWFVSDCRSTRAAALILAMWMDESPPEIVAQSTPGLASQKGHARLIGLVGNTTTVGGFVCSFNFLSASRLSTR